MPKPIKKPRNKDDKWANSIVFENHIQRCIECGDLIVRDKWFRIRKDNGIIVAFCSPEHEKKYDVRYAQRRNH